MKLGPKIALIGIALVILVYTSYKIGYIDGYYDGRSVIQESGK